MIFTDQRGESVREGFLLERIRRNLHERPASMRSGNPLEVLAGVVAAFRGGFQLTLLDGDGTGSSVGADDSFPDADGLADLRSFLREGRSEGRIILSTSGTTGKPEQVSHGLSSLVRGVKVGDKHRQAVWGLCYNPSHIAGLQVLLQSFLNDCDLVDLFNAGPSLRPRLIREAGITHLSATPSWMRILLFDLASDGPFGKVGSVTFGGERLDPGLAAMTRKVFPGARIRNIYAATEFGTLLVSEGEEFTVPEALAGWVRVEQGRLLVAEELMADPGNTSEEWYDTGDRVRVLEKNPLRFRFSGREDDNVSVGGYNVNLAEVESALRTHPGVREARVTARANSVLGQVLTAEVVPGRSDLTESVFRKHLEKHFPPQAVPRMISIVKELSLSRTGKLER